MDLLRHSAMGRLFGGVRAPSTLGSRLRSYTLANVTQLERAGREPGQAAEQASGRKPTPGLTLRDSSCRNRTGNHLPELAGGSRLRSLEAVKLRFW